MSPAGRRLAPFFRKVRSSIMNAGRWIAVLAVTWAGACTTPPPGGTSVRPGVNQRYFEQTDAGKWAARFERPDREIFARRAEIVRRVGLKPGQHVADIGAGTGFMALAFAEAVGATGKVYAVDLMPYFVEHIRERAAAAGATNVEAVLCREDDVNLAPASIDLAFLSDVYHHFEYPSRSMASIHRALRPGGEVILVDFRRIEGKSSDWVMGHVRAGQEVFEREIRGAGFERVGEEDFLELCYFVRFRKVDSPR
jgi:SAM-dependent methyltransferase